MAGFLLIGGNLGGKGKTDNRNMKTTHIGIFLFILLRYLCRIE